MHGWKVCTGNRKRLKYSYYFNINLSLFSLIARYIADARDCVYKNIRYVGPKAAPSRAFGPQRDERAVIMSCGENIMRRLNISFSLPQKWLCVYLANAYQPL